MAPTATPLETALTSDEPDDVRSALKDWDSSHLLEALGAQLDRALSGSEEATRAYVTAYRGLLDSLLRDAHALRPDLILVTDDGQHLRVEIKHYRAAAPAEALETWAAMAPFGAWTNAYGLADGIGVDMTDQLRALFGKPRMVPPETDVDQPRSTDSNLDVERFTRRVLRYLNSSDTPGLVRVAGALDLSTTELGRLFGVSRQAVDQWIANGVPAERREKLATLEALLDLLERKLKPDRLPGVARRPADAYGGKTMLELIGEDRHRELLQLTRDSFDWSAAA